MGGKPIIGGDKWAGRELLAGIKWRYYYYRREKKGGNGKLFLEVSFFLRYSGTCPPVCLFPSPPTGRTARPHRHQHRRDAPLSVLRRRRVLRPSRVRQLHRRADTLPVSGGVCVCVCVCVSCIDKCVCVCVLSTLWCEWCVSNIADRYATRQTSFL